MAFDIDSFWDNNYYNHPELTQEMIEYAEQALNVKLPAMFIEILKKQNGGYTKGFAFPMKQRTSWSADHISFYGLNGIVTDKEIKTTLNILDTDYMTKEWGLPPKQVLLAGDGHTWITLDYRQGDDPTVRWIDVECNEDIHIADNFNSFINGLVPEDQYADND